jgi:hypothetical protein
MDDLPEYTGKRVTASVRGKDVMQEPPGGWDTSAGVHDAVLYFKTTKDLACEGRNTTAIRTARRARDYGVSEELASELMWHHWAPRCEYEWEEDELRGKVARAYQNAQNDAGCRTMAYDLLAFRDNPVEE